MSVICKHPHMRHIQSVRTPGLNEVSKPDLSLNLGKYTWGSRTFPLHQQSNPLKTAQDGPCLNVSLDHSRSAIIKCNSQRVTCSLLSELPWAPPAATYERHYRVCHNLLVLNTVPGAREARNHSNTNTRGGLPQHLASYGFSTKKAMNINALSENKR